jgi:hypothetical protein
MSDEHLPRHLEREDRTVAVMIGMHCRDHHDGVERDAAGLCPECAALHAYARRRLEVCRYGAGKPTCVKCPTHCYRPEMRERVRVVMRSSGPRMLKTHPVLAVRHLIDGCRKAPGAPAKG